MSDNCGMEGHSEGCKLAIFVVWCEGCNQSVSGHLTAMLTMWLMRHRMGAPGSKPACESNLTRMNDVKRAIYCLKGGELMPTIAELYHWRESIGDPVMMVEVGEGA